ncbi:MAG: AraC family transcriptional regulator ligand-binding domain-containing protein [Polyangiales bacterium]
MKRVVANPPAGANTISGVVPWLVAARVGAEGADASGVLAAAGVGAEPPPRVDEHVDAARYVAAWRRATELVPDPAFPLRVAASFQLEDYEVFGFIAMSCATLGEAFDRTAAYRALFLVGARWELTVEPDATRLHWCPWPGDPRDAGYRAAMTFAVVDMANAVRRLAREGPHPAAVHLAHAAPADVAAHAAHFGVAPRFGAPLYELVYPAGLRELPVGSFNSRLRDYFDEACRRVLSAQQPEARTVEQVRRRLVHAMDGGDTSIERVAKDLGLSPRSLQRRLAEEGAGYSELLGEVRVEFAKRYLARGTVSASEVAYLVGFTEPPAFFKAFKRWTGMTPRAFQQGAGAG